MSAPSNSPPGAPPPGLVAAIEKLLRPLIRLMLAYQITYPQLIVMLKSIYVDVAEKDFKAGNKRQSDSRINLLTGVHRKDVKRLRSEEQQSPNSPQSASIGAQIIGHWLGNPDYLDANGEPRALSIKPESTALSEFDQLVESVCKGDIRPRVIIDEWLRLGVASIADNRISLHTGAFTPDKGFEEKAFFFGKNLQDHIAAGEHNLLGNKPAFFDRSVYYDGLSADSLTQLAALADELGMKALTDMNKAALAHQAADRSKPDANYRINFGIFNYNAELAGDNDDQPES